jgi:hypothetical protein
MVSMIFDSARFVVVVDDNFLLSILELAGAFSRVVIRAGCNCSFAGSYLLSGSKTSWTGDSASIMCSKDTASFSTSPGISTTSFCLHIVNGGAPWALDDNALSHSLMIFRGMRRKTHVAMIIAIIVRSGVEWSLPLRSLYQFYVKCAQQLYLTSTSMRQILGKRGALI